MTTDLASSKAIHVLGWAEQTRFWLLLAGLAALLALSVTLAVVIGPVPIPMRHVWQIAWSQIGGGAAGDWSQAQLNIVWLIRFPRVLMALCVGAVYPLDS